VRFARDEIYTYVGSLLLAVNPYKDIDGLYGEESMARFVRRRPSNPNLNPTLTLSLSLILTLTLTLIPTLAPTPTLAPQPQPLTLTPTSNPDPEQVGRGLLNNAPHIYAIAEEAVRKG